MIFTILAGAELIVGYLKEDGDSGIDDSSFTTGLLGTDVDGISGVPSPRFYGWSRRW